MKLSPDLADALKNEGGKKKVEVKIADSANLDSFRKITDKYDLEKSGDDIYSFHGKLNSDQVYELSQLREITAMSLAE